MANSNCNRRLIFIKTSLIFLNKITLLEDKGFLSNFKIKLLISIKIIYKINIILMKNLFSNIIKMAMETIDKLKSDSVQIISTDCMILI